MGALNIPVRYWAMHSGSPQENLESNVHYVKPVWDIETTEAALIMVDIWGSHAWKSHMDRSMDIAAKKIVPLVEAARTAGVTIAHAPAPLAAKKYPQWTRFAADADIDPPLEPPPPWPPEDFRLRMGVCEKYALVSPQKPPHVREAEDIADLVAPQPEDLVVATGNQLHRALSYRRILHLFYVGFATNSCVILRDYGMYAMRRLGYNTVLLRDCTTAIENSQTVADVGMTRFAIMDIERSSASATSADFIKACETRLEV